MSFRSLYNDNSVKFTRYINWTEVCTPWIELALEGGGSNPSRRQAYHCVPKELNKIMTTLVTKGRSSARINPWVP